MNKCKECGRDEWGFLSALNEDGYCPTCAIKHNQDKIKRLHEQKQKVIALIKDGRFVEALQELENETLA